MWNSIQYDIKHIVKTQNVEESNRLWQENKMKDKLCVRCEIIQHDIIMTIYYVIKTSLIAHGTLWYK